MTTNELKGHLIARLNNVEAMSNQLDAEIVRRESELSSLRAQLAAARGGAAELRQVLSTIDGAAAGSQAASG